MSQPAPYSDTNVRAFPPAPPSTKRTTTTSSTSSTTTTSTTTVQDSQILLRNKVELLRQLYEDAVGQTMPASALRQLLTSITNGTPWQYYEYALEETATAPQPAWRYTMAIVRRLIAEQAPADNVRGSQQRPRQTGSHRILEQQNYTQRPYTHTEDAVDAMMAAWQRGDPL